MIIWYTLAKRFYNDSGVLATVKLPSSVTETSELLCEIFHLVRTRWPWLPFNYFASAVAVYTQSNHPLSPYYTCTINMYSNSLSCCPLQQCIIEAHILWLQKWISKYVQRIILSWVNMIVVHVFMEFAAVSYGIMCMHVLDRVFSIVVTPTGDKHSFTLVYPSQMAT